MTIITLLNIALIIGNGWMLMQNAIVYRRLMSSLARADLHVDQIIASHIEATAWAAEVKKTLGEIESPK